MLLWTWQGRDYLPAGDCLDLSRSEYYRNFAGIRKAYSTLLRQLGVVGITWCFVRRDQYIWTPFDRTVEWVLDVPDDRILAVVDGRVWSRIIEEDCGPPQLLRDRWWAESVRLYANDAMKRERYLEHQEKTYRTQAPPRDGWWSCLRISDIGGEDATVLIPHPIDASWVMSAGAACLLKECKLVGSEVPREDPGCSGRDCRCVRYSQNNPQLHTWACNENLTNG